ncbi:hypothetical protein BC937DRAFT_86601, partial [Endogone sp. FLAS-F59071]
MPFEGLHHKLCILCVLCLIYILSSVVLRDYVKSHTDRLTFSDFLVWSQEGIKAYISSSDIPVTFHGKWKKCFLHEVDHAGLQEKCIDDKDENRWTMELCTALVNDVHRACIVVCLYIYNKFDSNYSNQCKFEIFS